MLLVTLTLKQLLERFMKKNSQQKKKKKKKNQKNQKNQNEFKVEKVIKRKGDILYVKWKGHDNSFNSWIDKKGIV